jgi:5-methylcytosine-specific restriction protein B
MLKELLEKINQRIEKLLDKDHLIGHSYFLKVSSITGLKEVLHHKINPLLQEYFFGDIGKIGLVLGSDFFEQGGAHSEEESDLFADFNEYDSSELSRRAVYHLRNVTEMSDSDFVKAIAKLMKR